MAGAGRPLSVLADRFPNLVVTKVSLDLGTYVLALRERLCGILFLHKHGIFGSDSEPHPCGSLSGNPTHHIQSNDLSPLTGVE